MAKTQNSRLTPLGWTALVLVIIGAVNWGLWGLFGFNLVAGIFGPLSPVSRLIYVLVGLAGLYMIYLATQIEERPHTTGGTGSGTGTRRVD